MVPLQIVQTPKMVLILYESNFIGQTYRIIYTDGRPLPKDADPSWLGYSVGHWEGDTFIVDTAGFNDKVWSDLSGNPRSEEMHLTERYRRLNHDTLEQQGWSVEIADAQKVKGLAPPACKTDKIDSMVLAVLSHRDPGAGDLAA